MKNSSVLWDRLNNHEYTYRISTEAPSKFKWLWSVHLHLVAIQVAEEAEEVVIEEEEALGVEAVVEEEEMAEMANNQIFKEDQETGGK